MGINGSSAAGQRGGIAGTIVGEIALGPFAAGTTFCALDTFGPFASQEVSSLDAALFNLMFGWLTIVENHFSWYVSISVDLNSSLDSY